MIRAHGSWPTNAHLIRDAVVPLGYLHKDWEVLDATYGRGAWWRLWRPDALIAHDLRTTGVDFTDLPTEWKMRFNAVTLDAPYKNAGKVTPEVDGRYGVTEYVPWQDRIRLIQYGIASCWYVIKPGGYLLVKCMDQVCGGKIRWQTHESTRFAIEMGMELVDRFDMDRIRPQPARTYRDKDGNRQPSRQAHARRGSTLLVFRRIK